VALKRTLHTARSPEQRSAVTNGSHLFAEAGIDLRGTWPRRFRDIYEMHVADLGGPDSTSTAEQSICRRIATLTVELERLEARLARNETPDDRLLDLYQRMCNTHRRLLESVGLERRARDVTPMDIRLLKAPPVPIRRTEEAQQ
jgi:hypothetical protein